MLWLVIGFTHDHDFNVTYTAVSDCGRHGLEYIGRDREMRKFLRGGRILKVRMISEQVVKKDVTLPLASA